MSELKIILSIDQFEIYYSSRYLYANKKILSVAYWDEVLTLDRQLVGPHYPKITYDLFKKWAAIGETIMNRMSRPLAKKWKDLSEELQKELIITHDKEHPEYCKIVSNLDQIELVTKMMKL